MNIYTLRLNKKDGSTEDFSFKELREAVEYFGMFFELDFMNEYENQDIQDIQYLKDGVILTPEQQQQILEGV